jgi:hypothetical protein
VWPIHLLQCEQKFWRILLYFCEQFWPNFIAAEQIESLANSVELKKNLASLLNQCDQKVWSILLQH